MPVIRRARIRIHSRSLPWGHSARLEGRGLLASQPGKLQDLINGYLEAFFAQASLSAGCNAVHNLNERCACWLLLTHDRVDSDTFDLKQEFLAVMLGVQRPSVSISAGTLQEAGLIAYRRGSITILHREGLEEATCPCYEMIRSEYSRLVPLVDGRINYAASGNS
ncbi:MAG TPA: helix-turn-helix domain-containing protein [Actinomycetota bacterium]|nr:helix-turn-helix domain-containing protein [Actinomycetota bacterium]